MTAIFKKEIHGYFITINGYIYLGTFLLAAALFFWLTNLMGGNANYAYAMSNNILIMLLLIPLLTMRLFSEEARQKTDQLLYTSPLTTAKIVLGKFLAAYALFAGSLLITVIFPFIISRYGNLPLAETVVSFAGYFLLGACYIAVGLFISSLTESQVAAAIISIITLFGFMLIDMVSSAAPTGRVSSVVFIVIAIIAFAFLINSSVKSILISVITGLFLAVCAAAAFLFKPALFDGVIYKVLKWISIDSRLYNFNDGILNVSDIVYFVTFAALFVFFTVNVIEKRRWS
ncbi:hypothetical protein FACS189490_11820 [Clostridia bacterium]|nr:hypothetical protein FACS189490_11820 [Clostridia bacterium]